jgi:hypothetical protein
MGMRFCGYITEVTRISRYALEEHLLFVARIMDHSTHEVVGGYEGGLTFLPIRLHVPSAGNADMPILVPTASLVPELGYAIPPGQWAIDLDVEMAGQGRFRIPPLPLTVTSV